MKGYAKESVAFSSGLATEYLAQEWQADLGNIRVMLELIDLTKFKQITIPERIPLLDLFRGWHVQLPMDTNALSSAKRTEKGLNILVFPLKLATVKTGECSIAHDDA